MNVLDNALEDLTLQIMKGVRIGNYGAFETSDQNVSSGYYVVKWTSKPYALQENTQLDDYKPPATGFIYCAFATNSPAWTGTGGV